MLCYLFLKEHSLPKPAGLKTTSGWQSHLIVLVLHVKTDFIGKQAVYCVFIHKLSFFPLIIVEFEASSGKVT